VRRKILEMHASGKLTHQDYRRFLPQFERLVIQCEKIRVLFEMKGFRGWKAATLLDDVKLDWKHFNSSGRQ
jgi:hypothetical protein